MRRTPATVLIGCLLVAAGCSSSAPRHDAPALSGYGWGSAASGPIGAASDRPVAVRLPAGTQSVALGSDFALALAGERVWSWGRNAAGQLGDGRRTDRHTPTEVLGLRDITAIAASNQYGMALDSSGSVYTWGSGSDGQLGNTTIGPQTHPMKIGMPGNVPIASIAAGPRQAVAVTRGGGVFTWGFGEGGELGIGGLRSASTPTRVGLPRGVRVRQVSVGDSHAVAVTDAHEALGWGSNADGRLGLGTRTVALRPARLPLGSDVDEVAAEAASTLARRGDGTVLAAGLNEHGELGDGTKTARSRFVPVTLPSEFRAGTLAAGPQRAFAVSADRTTVLAWGDGTSGGLGTGEAATVRTPVPITIGAGAQHVTGIVAGADVTVALVERVITRTRSDSAGPGSAAPASDGRSAGFAAFAIADAVLIMAVAAVAARRRLRARDLGLSGLFDAP